jgi:hypothetical protein
MEAGSGTSTVALRVVGGDEEPNAWGYKWATLFLEDIKDRDLALQVGGVSNLRQYNMGINPAGPGPENECAGKGQQQL